MSLNTILATTPLTSTNYVLKATGTTIGNSLIWDNGTNVGIGNTNTSYTLDVSGTGRFTSSLTATKVILSLGAEQAELTSAFNNDFKLTNSGNFRIINNANTVALLTVTNAGVATFSAGQINITGSGTSIQLQGTSYGNIAADKTLYLDSGASSDMILRTNGGTERMRILSGTNTLVIGGTAGAYTSTNRGNLTLSGSASALLGFHNGTTQTGYIYNDHSANIFQWYSVSNTILVTNTSLGVQLNANATSWSPASSDERTKKNFETTQGLFELLQIEPVKYHFIEEDDNKIKRLGFKAQNLQPLIPEMVFSTGKKMEDGSDILTITPDYLLPVLVKAIQELFKQNEELSNRLIKLESK